MTPDLAKIGDPAAWTVINTDPVTVTTTEDHGSVVRLAPKGGNKPQGGNPAMALVHGLNFVEGSVDVDLEGQGREHTSFLGIAFGVEEPNDFEAVYFRPFNFAADDPTHRVRAVQYVAWPGHTWEELRTHTPDVDEGAIAPVPDPAKWFHAHVEVTEKKVSVFVDHASEPCLTVDRLRSPRRGGIGLFVDSQAGSFANLRVEPRSGTAAPPVTTPSAPVAATSPLYDYDVVPLGPDVYGFVMRRGPIAMVTSNVLLVVGDDGALVMDTGHFPSLAEKMIADIRRITPKPVRYVVTSHWHPDHLAGNTAFLRAYPGAVSIAHAETRRLALEKDPEQIAIQRDTKGRIERFKHALASGEIKGKAMDEETRFALKTALPELEATVGDSDVSFEPPALTFEGDSMTVYLGAREVRLLHLGRGNTAGDVLAYVPDANVLATGDFVVAPSPYAYGSYPGEWQAVLRKVSAMHPATLLPGHGPVQHDLDYVQRVSDLLGAVRERVDACAKQGLSLDDTRKKVDLSDLRRNFAGDDPVRNADFDLDFAEPAVGRAYEESHGAIGSE